MLRDTTTKNPYLEIISKTTTVIFNLFFNDEVKQHFFVIFVDRKIFVFFSNEWNLRSKKKTQTDLVQSPISSVSLLMKQMSRETETVTQ